MQLPRVSQLLFPVSAFGLAALALASACSNDAALSGPLEGGDAAWDRPPLTPPGGEGTPPPGGEAGEDGGGATATAGGGGTTGDGGWDTGSETNSSISSSSDGGETYMCLPGPLGACNAANGVCEAALPDVGGGDTTSADTGTGGSGSDTGGSDTGGETDGLPPGDPAPCCEDVDCACDTSDCSVAPCQADGFCDGACPVDPDCGGKVEERPLAPPPIPTTAAVECPATQDPIVLYMSNDDSNSQASPALARRTIQEGRVVDPFRVRIHEFLNYYDLSYDNPGNAPATVGVQMRRIDADTGEFVLLLYAQGQKLDPRDRKPINLVFSLDTSGSMDGERLDLLKASMKAVAGSLREDDVISIVAWDDMQSVVLESHFVTGPDDPTLLAAIDGLAAGGSTDLSAGLITAYELAEQHYSVDRINRVMLISDGGANTGLTDEQLIGDAAGDQDGAGIYMIGVGVGDSGGYDDQLMDVITDKGKGAYLFVDSPAEAQRAFGEQFLRNVEVAARDVQMQLTLPWYFGIKEFHGEEYSEDPAEVEPQHLAPNDAMSYHQTIQSCDPRQVNAADTIQAKATFKHPITLEEMSSEVKVAIGEVVEAEASQLYKADVVVGFAQSLIVIGDLKAKGESDAAKKVALDMVEWLGKAADSLGDAEVVEMRDLMAAYVANL